MNRTLPSRLLFIFSGAAIAALSFWSTLKFLNQTPREPSVIALPAGTPTTKLAELPPLADPKLSWLGIAGLNAQVIPGKPVVFGVPILRLVALGEGAHTLAARVNGLTKNERYRITAWVKPQAGATFEIAARDQADQDKGQNNGRAMFDLASQQVLLTAGNVNPSIELVGDWLTVRMDLLTTDGQYVVVFYVCNGDAESYIGDGKLGVILGGIAAE
jgi:hypothetical protein